MAQYRFILGNGFTTRNARPIWKDGLSKEYAMEQGQMFMRASLSDSLVFINRDYDWIMAQDFETKIRVTLQVDWIDNGTWVDYWAGSFHQTDCTINTDDKTLKVKPNVEDRYNKVLAGLDKEYDLIKLAPAVKAVRMKRRPMLQVYGLGESIVSCFLGGMAWEQEVTSDDFTEQELQDDLHFGLISNTVQISIASPPSGMRNGFTGTWDDHGTTQGEWNQFSGNDGIYYMSYFQEGLMNGVRLYSYSDAQHQILYEYSQQMPSLQSEYDPIPDNFTLISKRTGYGNLSASQSRAPIYARWILGSEKENSFKIPSNDLVANNRNYKWCYPYNQASAIRTNANYSTTPTEWGMRPDGKYYVKPQILPDEQYVIKGFYPVGRSLWQATSFWLEWDTNKDALDTTLSTQMTLRDAFTIEAVIAALLAVIDPSVTFAGTTAYSTFLFGTNPLMNDFGRLVISPKSNLLVAEYTQPAQTAPITLAEVLNMLRNALGCYWYIDDSNRLRIEHVSYFKNGMSYSGTPSVGYDVTEMFNSRNRHSWVMGTGTISFDKLQMPERYEYSWMDDTTEPFRGMPIEVRSTFVQEGNIEDVSIGNFNPDVDYILLNPSDVSEDGFALMCCQVSGGVYQLAFQEMQIGENWVNVQNPQLTMVVLQPAFLISDMPSWNITVNGENTTAKGIQRMKKQQINVPIGNGDGTLTQLVKTSIGNGEVERMTINLTSRKAKFDLRFNTTEQ